MEHIKKKLAVIVVFFAVFIGIVTIWTVRKQSQPKLTAVTWKLEEEADLDGNELSSYAKDPSKSKVVLTFKKDQTYRCKNLENKKAELEEKEYVVTSGGGMVEITAKGDHTIKAIGINPEVVDPEDVEMLEDMLVAAFNEAMRQIDEESERELEKVTGGLNIPGL